MFKEIIALVVVIVIALIVLLSCCDKKTLKQFLKVVLVIGGVAFAVKFGILKYVVVFSIVALVLTKMDLKSLNVAKNVNYNYYSHTS